MKKYNDILKEIKSANKIALFGHTNTDGDAMGSMLGLKFFLEEMGKQVDFFSETIIPDNIKFLPQIDLLNNKTLDSYDLAIAVDTSQERLGVYEKSFFKIKKSILFDHHTGNKSFATYNIIDPNASSTCLLIFKFLQYFGLKINKNTAVCLLTGILTDTGGLRFSNTDSETVQAFSELSQLVEISLYKLNKLIFDNHSKKYFEIYKRAINNTHFYADNKIVFVYLKYQDFETVGVDYRTINNLTRIGTELKDTGITILLVESKPSEYTVSFRSSGSYNARRCAEVFGGGGHTVAAGCKLYGSFEAAKEKLLKCAIDEIGL